MPKVTPPAPVLTNLLGGRIPLVLQPKPAGPAAPPVDRVVVRAPAAPVQHPSTPPQAPQGLSRAQLAQWVAAELANQEQLRAGSFWDSGYLLGLLMPQKELLGFQDLKTLIETSKLGISHMTAQKYLMVARAFDRETARQTGIEKCYALTLYAKAVGRAGQAGAILAGNEKIQGGEPGQRAPLAQSISASQLRAATRRLKESKRQDAVPTAVQAERVKLGNEMAKVMRSLGLKKASAKVVRHDGEAKIAIYFPIESARTLETALLPSMTTLLGKLARKEPEVVTLLLAKVPGLTLKRAA